MITPSLSSRDIRAYLSAEHRALDIRVYDTLDSTNSEAKRQARSGCLCPALILARTQTDGRGRLGRSFHSPADTGLYMTLLYDTDRSLGEAVRVTAAAAVAVVQAIEALTDKRPLIKWVNDVYLDGAKLCGILTEAVTDPDSGRNRMAVGIGVNVTTQDFPDGLRAPATSLAARGEAAPNINRLASAIADRLLDRIVLIEAGLADPDCLALYRARSLLIGKPVRCTRGDEVLCGVAEGVGEDYALLLRLKNGEMLPLSSGEASVREERG